ncbi:hypothetical protein DR62_06605 [Burkholderia thailandensis]|nr:hypothetical protein DR62_06605 [Burkholderia thailandensis]AOI52198.1 hypothetical protein WI24_10550 [Burkholderia thailandensis]
MTGRSANGRATRFDPTPAVRAFDGSACAATRRASCSVQRAAGQTSRRASAIAGSFPSTKCRSRPTMPPRRAAAIRLTRAPRAFLHFRRRYCSTSLDAGNEAGDHEIRPPFRIEFEWNWFWIE